MKMFIAGPDGGRPALSVPSARAATPLAPAPQRSDDSGVIATSDPVIAPDSVLAAASQSSDRALRGELSAVSAELQNLDAQLTHSRRQIRWLCC